MFNKCVISRMTFPKTKLLVKKKVVIFQVMFYSVVHYSPKNFRKTQKNGKWLIVVSNSFLPDLKIGNDDDEDELFLWYCWPTKRV